MSTENDTIQRIGSPLNSGRSSPVTSKARQKDEDGLLKKDKGYRRYASTVERVLAQFDTAVEEWADYISFLGRLLKALSIKPSGFTDIPHKTLVAKRLAQCLNPKLPSGVHQKTLEVYSYIFSTLGKEGLSSDLALYLPGLTPVLSFAALSVKPNVLAVFESHIVPLKPSALRPALKSLLLALLPGLEEESSDEFDRTLRILEALKRSVAAGRRSSIYKEETHSDQYFWQCMFLACITSTSRRPGVLAYLMRYLPALGHASVSNGTAPTTNGDSVKTDREAMLLESMEAVISPEPGLLIRSFCAGLQDQQPLIQRGFLDLLVTHLPLDSTVLQTKVVPVDLERLVIAATSVVARKDMSLNRRLWSWFLGPELSSETNGETEKVTTPAFSTSPTQNLILHQTQYFERYGLRPLVRGIFSMLGKNSMNPADRTKPLRIGLSIMDRWEIGGLVVPKIFLAAIQSAWKYQSTESSAESQVEVLKSANMFFDGVESSLIWSEIYGVISRALQPNDVSDSEASDILLMIEFVVHNFNIREEEMQTIHMPLALLMICLRLNQLLKTAGSIAKLGPDSAFLHAFKIANRIFELIPPRALSGHDADNGEARLSITSDEEVLEILQTFYADNKGSLPENKPFSAAHVGAMLLESCITITTKLMDLRSPQSHLELDLAVSLLSSIILKAPHARPKLDNLFATLVGDRARSSNQQHSFTITAAKVTVLEAICASNYCTSWVSEPFARIIFPALISETWQALSPSRPKYNVEAVRCIWRLYTVYSDRKVIESTIMTLMIQNFDGSGTNEVGPENARRFSTLWAYSPTDNESSHSRRPSIVRSVSDSGPTIKPTAELMLLEKPLMLLLDSLHDPGCSLFKFVVNWIQSLNSLTPVLQLFMRQLMIVRPVLIVLPTREENVRDLLLEEDPHGLQMCLYYLQNIDDVLEYSTANVWPALASQFRVPDDSHVPNATIQDHLTTICIKILQGRDRLDSSAEATHHQIYETSLTILKRFYSGPLVTQMVEKKLEEPLIQELIRAVEAGESALQTSLMEVILVALKNKHTSEAPTPKSAKHRPSSSRDFPKTTPSLSVTVEAADPKSPGLPPPPPMPGKLLECIILGIKSPSSRSILESWIAFLGHCLPLYDTGIFQVLLPLVGCFCNTLESLLDHVREAYQNVDRQINEALDSTISLLLNGLEQTLAAAHDVLTSNEATSAPVKSPEPQPSGFFGNMVSGVFASDAKITKTLTANNRLTVLLCFKDAMRICFSLWTWGDISRDGSSHDTSASTSFSYITVRLRNRTRRIFEHLFAAETLECLETLVEMWQKLPSDSSTSAILNLLSTLESSKPKIVIRAIFNAIYSRTNPNALEPSRKSTLTSTLDDDTSASFLVAYLRSLDDDAMDEIWVDCITLIKDVLANPMPHRQILPRLIEFTAALGEKVDNTTFGEQRKPRRELGDLFMRLLTATLTIRPMGVAQDTSSGSERATMLETNAKSYLSDRYVTGSEGLIPVLAAITPSLSKVLLDAERITSATNTVSNQVVGPIFRAKTFPENVTQSAIELLQGLSKINEASKTVKRDIAEAFTDSRFFSTPLSLARDGWLPILRSWSLGDKERMPELLSRLTSPASAGVLGIGASSARIEADRRTQLNLRRIALLILAAIDDTYVVNLGSLQDKIIDLLNATTTSSPSFVTRAEIYMVIRALVLKISPVHLAPLWPTINSELFDAISAAYPTSDSEIVNVTCLLQACKLLDTLLMLELDEFQMQEWLFISDTTDAVYRPPNLPSVALVDDLTEALDEQKSQASGHLATDNSSERRKPILTTALTKDVAKDKILDKVLRPFFRQLSIHAFESTYGMQIPDMEACFDELMADLFDTSTLV